LRLALCGDGLVGGRVEGAWVSGVAAAEQLLAGW
jgi:predicted NAD/FAD-dependent oxidoreductase